MNSYIYFWLHRHGNFQAELLLLFFQEFSSVITECTTLVACVKLFNVLMYSCTQLRKEPIPSINVFLKTVLFSWKNLFKMFYWSPKCTRVLSEFIHAFLTITDLWLWPDTKGGGHTHSAWIYQTTFSSLNTAQVKATSLRIVFRISLQIQTSL